MAIRLIDELIVYLRAALPHLRESTSTVAKEAELALAWFNIRRLRAGSGPELDIDVGADAAAARLPPMILLPLVDHLLGDPARHPRAVLRVVAQAGGRRLRIVLTHRGATMPADGPAADTLTGVRERLALLYGEAATLAQDAASAGALTVILDIPHEPTDSHPR